jgi:hypothetical protein
LFLFSNKNRPTFSVISCLSSELILPLLIVLSFWLYCVVLFVTLLSFIMAGKEVSKYSEC